MKTSSKAYLIRLAIIAALLACSAAPARTFATEGVPFWTKDGTNVCTLSADSIPAATAGYGDYEYQIIPEESSPGVLTGGAIFAWVDNRPRTVTYQNPPGVTGPKIYGSLVYVQKISNAGKIGGFGDWANYGRAATGIPVSWQPELIVTQEFPELCSDGNGGALITWQEADRYKWHKENEYDKFDIFVQWIDSYGTPRWSVSGLDTFQGAPVCTVEGVGNQLYPKIAPDGSGGAYITWYDYRNTYPDIYIQRITNNGTMATGWPLNGKRIYQAANQNSINTFDDLQIVSDGTGGAIIAWARYNAQNKYTVYAQRITGNGTTQWGASDGMIVCQEVGHQDHPRLISDGAGGAVIVWDYGGEIHGQRILASGSPDPSWGASGKVIGNYPAYLPQIMRDGANGAIITWCNSGTPTGIYAQKIDLSGNRLWNPAGVDTTCRGGPYWDMASDNNGGVIIVFEKGSSDFEYFNNPTRRDIYAQRINSSGIVQWTAGGNPVCVNWANQEMPKIASDGRTGANIIWQDWRNGTYGQWDNWNYYPRCGTNPNYYVQKVQDSLDHVYVSPFGPPAPNNDHNDENHSGNDGDPFGTIQRGLNKAGTGGVVHLVGGTFTGDRNYDIVWPNRNGITLSGEVWSGALQTTISAEYKGRVFKVEDSVQLTIKNLIIKNGSAEPEESDPEHPGNIIRGGGAIYVPPYLYHPNDHDLPEIGVSPTIYLNKVDFISNEAITWNSYGGAIYLNHEFSGDTLLSAKDCNFIGNKANGYGGAVALLSNNVTSSFEGCTFRDNRSFNTGGAFYLNGQMLYPKVVNCKFVRNQASYYGGAVGINYGSMNTQNCIFAFNKTVGDGSQGGAVYGGGHGGLYAQNCTFYGNSSVNSIGWGSTNNGDIIDGVFIGATNCIFWHTGGSYWAIKNSYPGSYMKYCDCTGQYDYPDLTATNCINSDPLFINTTNEASPDFLKLKPYSDGWQYSPCMDTGTAEIWGATASDITGIKRPQQYNPSSPLNNYDMGCYEQPGYQYTYYLYVSNSGSDTTGTGTIDKPFKTIQKALGLVSENCTIFINAGTYKGAGNKNLSWPNAQNVTITNNGGPVIIDAEGSGRIFNVAYPVQLTMTNLTLKGGNAGGEYGGAVALALYSKLVLNKVRFIGNAASRGGAIYSYYYSTTATVEATNCLFSGNSAAYGGAAYGGRWKIVNCTFSNNTSPSGGDACHAAMSLSAINSIFWGSGDQFPSIAPTFTFKYCDVLQGTAPGTGYINSDPKFMSTDPLSSTFLKLAADSPCVNSGTFEGAPTTDINGIGRPQPAGGIHDMGCFEQGVGNIVYVSPSGDDGNLGTISSPFKTIQTGLEWVPAGGTVIILAGNYTGIRNYNLTWPSRDNITLKADPAATAPVTVDALGSGKIFKVPSAVQLSIEAVTIKNANTSTPGGGISLEPGSTLRMKKVKLIGNNASFGGAVFSPGSSVYAENCVFGSNWASSQGSAAYGGNWTAVNCTFYNGGTAIYGGSWKGRNTIFWGSDNQFESTAGTLEYCDVQNKDWSGFTTKECIFGDPSFASTYPGDPKYLNLSLSSSCIDTGTSEGAPSTDIDGFPRPFLNGYDMGAYEFSRIRVINSRANKGYPTIKAALSDITSLEPGDLITAEAGMFYEYNIIWPSVAGVTLRGSGTGVTTIDALAKGTILSVTNPVSLSIEALAISNGNGSAFGYAWGGGIWLNTSNINLKLKDVNFSGNSAYRGGAVRSLNSTDTITAENCVFSGNSSINYGGVADQGTWNVSNCIFNNNSSANGGVGSIVTWTATNCVFSGNNAGNGGVAYQGAWKVSNCIFNNNTSNLGGVAYLATLTATNCVFSGNNAGNGGVADSGTWEVFNSTFVNNTGYPSIGDSVTWNAVNSIIWGGGDGDTKFDTSSSGTLKYCYTQGDTGILVKTNPILNPYGPRFVSVSASDFHLNMSSPCIDAGTKEGAPARDIEGSTRTDPPDLGAYEYTGGLKVHNQTLKKDYALIGSALKEARAWDLITLEAYAYSECGISWSTREGITLRGAGSNESIIYGEYLGVIFDVPSPVSLSIEALTITGGSALSGNGGAISLESASTLWLKNVNFNGNSAPNGAGGAVFAGTATVIASDSAFSNNSAYNGGAAYGGNWNVYNCAFSGNRAYDGGVAYQGNWIVNNCTFSGNIADYYYNGAVASYGNWSATNCVFSGNSGSVMSNSTLTAVNCTFNNSGYAVYNGTVLGINSIFWGTSQTICQTNGTLKYCDYQGSWGGTLTTPECISRPPMLKADLRLNPSSPCIGTGTGEGAPAKDKDGNTRKSPPDIGAYEFYGIPKVHNETRGLLYYTIFAALNDANPGDRITLEACAYYEYSILWPATEGITLRGAGADLSIISAESQGRVFKVNGPVQLTIESLTISGGSTTPEASPRNGGGINLPAGARLSLNNVNFTGNAAAVTGGSGGAVYASSANVWVKAKNCVFKNNAAYSGGVLYFGTWEAANCTFEGNSASANGGVAYLQANNSFTATDCAFSANTSGNYGGVLYGGRALLVRSRFINNHSGTGGVFYFTSVTTPITAINCLFSGNSANTNGGVAYWGKWRAINCTFGGNSAGTAGQVANGGKWYATNCIFWGGIDSFANITMSTMEYCDVQAGDWAGFTIKECISSDPLFTTDLRLLPTSECVDTGTSEGAQDDIFGNPRPKPNYVPLANYDRGCYEIRGKGKALLVYVSVSRGNDDGYGTIDSPYKTIQAGLDDLTAEGHVIIEAGTYSGAGDQDITWPKKNNITISGAGNNLTIINVSGRHFNVPFPVNLTIKSLTLNNGNASGGSGGSILLAGGSSLILSYVKFNNNTAQDGGAVYSEGSSVEAVNCVFTGNSAANNGGAASGGSWKTVYCTFYNNSAAHGGTAFGGDWQSLNSIFWGTDDQFDSTTGTLEYCDVQAADWIGLVTAECITGEPRFVDPANNDLHLMTISPCLDTGINRAGVPTDDIDGMARPQIRGVDRGAYETRPNPPKIVVSSIKVNGVAIGNVNFLAKKPVVEANILDEYLAVGETTVEVRFGTRSYIAKVQANPANDSVHIVCQPDADLAEGDYEITIIATNVYNISDTYIRHPFKVSEALAIVGAPKNNPNPFRPKHGEGTNILYSLTRDSDISLKIFDITGILVWQRSYNSGSNGGTINNDIYWDGKADNGQYVPNGAYIYLLTTKDKIIAKGHMAVVD